MHKSDRFSCLIVWMLIVIVSCGTTTAQTIVITGGTLIDLTNSGRSSNDLSNAFVLVKDGRFVAVGSMADNPIPPGAMVINARGKYLIPGLIDGFGALRNQRFANAYLYEGVTTVYVASIVPGGGGDGEVNIFRNASPGPHLFLGAPMTGYSADGFDPSDKPMKVHRLHDRRLSNDQLIARVDHLADDGFRGLTVSYDVWPDQLDRIIAEAHRQGLAVLGEPGFTTYPYAIRAGIDTLLRNDHYQMALTPAPAQLKRADEPAAGVEAYHALCAISPDAQIVQEFGEQLSNSHTALMPTLALEATADSLDIPNPWSSRSAKLIKPTDLDIPVDPDTGESGFLKTLPADRRSAFRACGRLKEAIDASLFRKGARFLAGSSATSYGIMPGSGLHLELLLLHRIGLTPREAIAAATTNFADVYGWKYVGKIEVGRLADLLLLDRDPRVDLSAIEAIHTIVANGRVINRDQLLNVAGMK